MELTAVRWGHFLYRGRRCLGLPLRLCHAGGNGNGEHKGSKEQSHFVALQGERTSQNTPHGFYRPSTLDLYWIS